jgi:hypothetical protein
MRRPQRASCAWPAVAQAHYSTPVQVAMPHAHMRNCAANSLILFQLRHTRGSANSLD